MAFFKFTRKKERKGLSSIFFFFFEILVILKSPYVFDEASLGIIRENI